MREIAGAKGRNVYCEMNVDRMAEGMTDWIQEANGKYMKGRVYQTKRSMQWWTKELGALKRHARKSRKAWQNARKDGGECVNETLNQYKRVLNEYKYLLRRMKEENWKRFVSVYSNLDPWGAAYRICRRKNVGECLTSWCVNGIEYVTWNECANVLMEWFFLAMSDEVCIVSEKEEMCVRSFEWSEVDRAIGIAMFERHPAWMV